jgi:hypothetical protein
MRLSLVFVSIFCFVLSATAQVNFSASIDVGEPANSSTGIFNDMEGMLVINSFNVCPENEDYDLNGLLASCSGYISYH